MSTIIERIKKELETITPETGVEEVGTVVAVGDGVAEIEGIRDARMMEMVLFDDTEGTSLKESMEHSGVLFGLVLNLEEESVKVVVLGDANRVKEGMLVRRTGKLLSIPVGEGIIGRVVTPLGEVLDGKAMYATERDMAI